MTANEILNRPVSSIMSSVIHRVSKDNVLRDAEHLFHRYKIKHLPVVSGDEVVGMLSLTDLQRMSFATIWGEEENSVDETIVESLTVGQVMKHRPKTIAFNESIENAADILSQAEFHALPVVDDGKLVGIITTTDIIKFLLKHFKEM